MNFKSKFQKIVFLKAILLYFSLIYSMDQGNNVENKNNNVLEKFERFSQLPVEIQKEILRHTRFKDIKNFKLASKKSNEISQNLFKEKKIVADMLGLDIIKIISYNSLFLHQVTKAIKIINSGDANLNRKNDAGDTVLMVASFFGHLDIVKLLVKELVDINIKNNEGNTALILTKKRAIVELLINAGADLNVQDQDGMTALMKNCMEILFIWKTGEFKDIVKLLIEVKADLNIQDKKGRTAFIIASMYGFGDIVQLLIDNGADLYIKDINGHSAIEKSSDEVIYNIILDGIKKKNSEDMIEEKNFKK